MISRAALIVCLAWTTPVFARGLITQATIVSKNGVVEKRWPTVHWEHGVWRDYVADNEYRMKNGELVATVLGGTKERWRLRVGDTMPTVDTSEEAVIVRIEDRQLRLDPRTGKRLPEKPREKPACVASAFAHVACEEQAGLRVDGTRLFATTSTLRAVALMPDALAIYEATGIRVLDLKTGVLKWQLAVTGDPTHAHTAQVMVTDKTGAILLVVVPEDDEHRVFTVRAHDVSSGAERWRVAIAPPEGFSDQRGVSIERRGDGFVLSAWGLILD